MKKVVDLFLDSGAFSAFSQGVTIDLKEYIAFIKKYEKHLTVYASLDVIGDPVATEKNQIIMEKAGLHPLPCFHYGEPVDFLEKMLKKYDYIALGGMAGKDEHRLFSNEKVRWLDNMFEKYLCDGSGEPRVKVHGYGMTSIPLMVRYPWYSVDSTSWVTVSRLGSLFVPDFSFGKWNYLISTKVDVSNRSPRKYQANSGHLETLPPTIKKWALSYFKDNGWPLGESEEAEMKLDHELADNEAWIEKDKKKGTGRMERRVVEGLSNHYRFRDRANIHFFLELEKALPKWPWSFHKMSQRPEGFGL